VRKKRDLQRDCTPTRAALLQCRECEWVPKWLVLTLTQLFVNCIHGDVRGSLLKEVRAVWIQRHGNWSKHVNRVRAVWFWYMHKWHLPRGFEGHIAFKANTKFTWRILTSRTVLRNLVMAV
jgi:hypothetical protein